MKEVKSIHLEHLHRGIAIIFTTKDGEIYPFKIGMHDIRQLTLRVERMLGTKRGEGERHPPMPRPSSET